MIFGQDRVVKEIEKILEIFLASEGEIKPHFILTGQSGSGKTYAIKTLSEKMKINFIEINAAQLTKEGTSGNSLSKALTPLVNSAKRNTIVFVDEFDKLFISGNSNSSSAHETTLGVQNEFLKVLESERTSVFGDYGKYIEVDTSKVLFIFAGAFNNEEDVTIDKLRAFGVKTEFIGRVGLVYHMNKLKLEDLYLILENSELLSKYLKLFVDVNRKDVEEKIKSFLSENYEGNSLGARMVNTLVSQYFIKGGNLGFEEVKDITFQTKLNL